MFIRSVWKKKCSRPAKSLGPGLDRLSWTRTEDGHLTGIDAVGADLAGVVDAQEAVLHGADAGVARRVPLGRRRRRLLAQPTAEVRHRR